jgi:hypothetical protein
LLRKLFIAPYFGQLPSWFEKYLKNFEAALTPLGYDLLLDADEEKFKQRVADKLNAKCAPLTGTRKLSDLRLMLGELYEKEVADYDFWGLTDFDCAYGRVDKFISDAQLAELDIHSNHHCYICGPWSLFRNTPKINSLFREYPDWRTEVERESMSGWGEQEYSAIVDREHNAGRLRRLYTHFQGKNPDDISGIRSRDGALYDGDTEIMMCHFNRIKQWPEGV